METPVQITFRNLTPSEYLEAEIRERAARLDTYYERILECRVLVELPHRHHRRGNRFHVRIELKVPGEDIVVTQEPSPGPAIDNAETEDVALALRKAEEAVPVHKYASVAVREAFDVARRRLQDYARRQRGAVKVRAV